MQFACDICQKSFANASVLRRHHVSIHAKTRHGCEDCDKSFSRLDVLKRHQQKCGQITSKLFIIQPTCDICQKTFTRGTDLRRHEKNVHDKTRHGCKDCDKSFSRLDALKRHQKKCGQITFKCSRCLRTFANMASFTTHLLCLCPIPTCSD